MTRSVERVLEEAHFSGYLKLNGRKLKEFPDNNKYDLDDTVFADLSRNRFTEIPNEISRLWCLEQLIFHHNCIKNVSDSISYLQSLVFLDLSHNQLTSVSSIIFHLPLEILLLSNNKLQSLPTEIGYCKTLAELDISCNIINRLPPQLGLLNSLRYLNIRSNLLLEIPIELTYLKLTSLDISRNRISSLPLELKNMSVCLENLRLNENPLLSPPAVVCARGMVHVFKWLDSYYSKQDKKQVVSSQVDSKNIKWKYGDLIKNHPGNNNIDWSYLNIDPTAQMVLLNEDKMCSSKSQDKRIFEQDIDKNGNRNLANPLDANSPAKSSTKYENPDSHPCEKPQPQTYKEYKASLRQQRTTDSVYKCSQKESNNVPFKGTLPVGESVAKTQAKYSELPTPKQVTKEPVKGDKFAPLNQNKQTNATMTRSKPRAPDIPIDKMQFTMRREFEKAKEEAELIKQLRSTIETRLKMTLPENLPIALSDGVVLCHFANHIMPQSVGSVHVPSPTVPKLTTARSRRNVDNFLEACRKIGLDEELLCNGADLIDLKEDTLERIAIILDNLIKKSRKFSINSCELADLETLAQKHTINAFSSSPSSNCRTKPTSEISKKCSTIFCLSLFISINLLLYWYPIPEW